MENYLVIGASSGIGKQLTRDLIDAGHQVWGSYFQHPIEKKENFTPFKLKVQEGGWDESLLPEHLDGLVYCPGSIQLKPFLRIKEEDFLQDLDLNLLGAVKVIQKALPKLKKVHLASIVLFSTVAVQLGLPYHAQVAATKGALEGLTRALATELAPKIRVNCIAPSLTDTPMAESLLSSEEKRQANAQRHPLKRIGQPKDIAEMAAFLLSDKSTWISGQILPVDGGMSSMRG
ncbi:SDR family oxidoreductase [Echinicola jeungdonensis]|uniref:SDR family NAD(P)-dependent oxidoreductase n=1 Tax=Echinicola jeungdonensis TaxID=709343 RepID=A0ABV5J4Q2_9BACT|nr:SDR family oxidoreductase [Echinicola jeungdonensis]MDN3668867.1 SDR family oxidoreductase [Echinicola jeungdonensis]